MAVGYKTGGRQAGTPNKLTSEIKEILGQFLQKEIDSIPDYFKEIEPKEKLEIITKLLPFVVPRQRAFDEGSNNKLLRAPQIVLTDE